MLQDLILAAINDAHRKVDEQLGQADVRSDGRPEDSRF
jgi:DNA-binding protein YbaB